MLNIAYGLLLAMLLVALWVGRVHDGAAKTHSKMLTTCAQVRRATSGEPATRINRIRAKRAQRRCDQWELRAWLQITAYPL
jgi:hypothetical protein